MSGANQKRSVAAMPPHLCRAVWRQRRHTAAPPRATLIERAQSNRSFVDLCCNMLDFFNFNVFIFY